MNWNNRIQYLRSVNPHFYQNEVELGYALACIENISPKHYIEIGTLAGASLWVYGSGCCLGSVLISIDPNPSYTTVDPISNHLREGGYDVHIVSERSHDSIDKVRSILNNKKVDLLHIDGDHDFLFQDWNDYRDFVSPGGVIIIHDVLADESHKECRKVGEDWIRIKKECEHEGLKWKEFGFPSFLLSDFRLDWVIGVGLVFIK